MAKRFLSFLGTSDYKPCLYYCNDVQLRSARPGRFVQTAMMEIFCANWSEKDQATIFVTKDAKHKNWQGALYAKSLYTDDAKSLTIKDFTDLDKQGFHEQGLCEQIKKANLPFSVDAVDIPDGKNETEIWQVFHKIVETIQDGEEIIFDITHGFRSLPMLAMVVIQYASLLKNITILGIHYGAFEATHNGSPSSDKGHIGQNSQKRIDNLDLSFEAESIPKAPIFDLTLFSSLQEWSLAAHDFIKNGDAKMLAELTQREAKPVIMGANERAKAGSDEKSDENRQQALKIKDYMTSLRDITEDIRSVRGPNIQDFRYKLAKQLNAPPCLAASAPLAQPLNPLLDLIHQKVKSYKPDNVVNGFHAVRWCLDYDLIQQGYTLLQEFIVTQLLIEIFGSGEKAKKYQTRYAVQEYLRQQYQQYKKLSNTTKTEKIADSDSAVDSAIDANDLDIDNVKNDNANNIINNKIDPKDWAAIKEKMTTLIEKNRILLTYLTSCAIAVMI